MLISPINQGQSQKITAQKKSVSFGKSVHSSSEQHKKDIKKPLIFGGLAVTALTGAVIVFNAIKKGKINKAEVEVRNVVSNGTITMKKITQDTKEYYILSDKAGSSSHTIWVKGKQNKIVTIERDEDGNLSLVKLVTPESVTTSEFATNSAGKPVKISTNTEKNNDEFKFPNNFAETWDKCEK